MSDIVKAYLIVAGAVLFAVALYIYFSPYQSCVRAQTQMWAKQGEPNPEQLAQRWCTEDSN